MKIKIFDNKAVINLIGIILLLGISIAIFSGLNFFVLSIEPINPPPHINGLIRSDDNFLYIENWGGEAIRVDELTIQFINETSIVYIHPKYDDEFFSIGSILKVKLKDYHGPYSVNLLHNPSNSILLRGYIN